MLASKGATATNQIGKDKNRTRHKFLKLTHPLTNSEIQRYCKNSLT